MPGTIATISGTMLTPGVSRNGRLYTPELIASAVHLMQQRIADPDGLPIVMRTHHDAGDDSARIVGRLTDVTREKDGSASYKAVLYDTSHGRDIATLVVPAKGQPPALRSVSIHGYWTGPVKRITHEGQQVTTADGLEIDALDFTATPGVLGASVTSASYTADAPTAAESSGGRTPITESAEATIEAITEDVAEASGLSARQRRQLAAQGKAMADGSYPIRNKADLRKAIRAVGRGGADHDAIRRHIAQRAKALGLTALIPATWKDDGSMTEAATRYSDVREYYPDGPTGAAGFCVDAYNGPVSITLRACGIDPAELRVITAAAMQAAVDALSAMDPDMDADIDIAGAPSADTDGDTGGPAPDAKAKSASKETAEPAPQPVVEQASAAEPALTENSLPGPGEAAPTTQEEELVSEPTAQETAAPARSLTDADLSALGAAFAHVLAEKLDPVTTVLKESRKAKTKAAKTKESRKAGKPGVSETAPAAENAPKAKVSERDALKAQVRTELREELLREFGIPGRRGYRVGENDQSDQDAARDAWDNRADRLLGDFGITPKPA